MRYLLISGVAALGLAGCGPSVPDSGAGVADSGRGVGFQDYDQYELEREAALRDGTRPTTIPGPVDVRATPLDAGVADQPVQSGAVPRVQEQTQGQVPGQGIATSPSPQVVTNSVGISDENDFDAVSAQRDIDGDAALIAQNRAQYQVIEPAELPTRPGSNRPSIVEYALRTSNPVGVALYRRSGFNAEKKYARACGGYTSADLAQEDFLALGGPEKDRKGMDPDGDGFACTWDPSPYRAARNG